MTKDDEEILAILTRGMADRCGDENVRQHLRYGTASLVGKYLNPVEYARNVLHVELTYQQEEIAQRLCEPPYKQLVRAAHNVGKSYLAAVLVNWWFDTFDPCIVLTTAPKQEQVRDIIWKEIRRMRDRAKRFDPNYQLCFPGPKDTRLETRADHIATGLTARTGSHFQGQHGPAILIIFDEAVGVEAPFWEAAEPMLGGARYAFLGIYNPTSTTARAYHEESEKGYHPVITMSCLDHPNILAELKGEPAPVKDAIHLSRLKEMLEKWATPVDKAERTPYDIVLDETKIGGKITIYRPGPIAECRLLGRWPSISTDAVWSTFAFDRMLDEIAQRMPDTGPLQIGVDIADYGEDDTVWVVRKGGVVLYMERRNGWTTNQIVEKCKQLAVQWGRKYKIDHKKVPLVIDAIGVGTGVRAYLQVDSWNVIGVNVQHVPDSLREAGEFDRIRSYLWFGVRDAALRGEISLTRLLPVDVQCLKDELLAVKYGIDMAGRQVVEPKEKMKERIGKSPDMADAFNLAFVPVAMFNSERVAGRVEVAR